MERYSLILADVTRRFGDTTAVRRVLLEVPLGQFVGVIGRSGAGKSRLLRLINRLIDPTSGRITDGGRDVTTLKGRALREWRRDCAMIFQQFNLVDRLDLLANVLVVRLADRGFLLLMAMRFSDAERAAALMRWTGRTFCPRRFRRQGRSRVASSSASPWPARWCRSPASCWPTNPSPASIPATRPA